MEVCFTRRPKAGEEEEEEEVGTPSSSSSSFSEFAGGDSDDDDSATGGNPYQMSSLAAELPFKRGLSRHFQGKSQSFTSLAEARCLDDLVKPERQQRKKMKPCRSYAGGLDSHGAHISKKSPDSNTVAVSLSARRRGFGGAARPSIPPPQRHLRPGGFSAHNTLLFA